MHQRHAGSSRPGRAGFGRACRRGLAAAALLAAALLPSGCLYSTHNFATGALLPAGRSQATLGVGRQTLWSCSEPKTDSTGGKACNQDGSGRESVDRTEVPKGSLEYRLGVRDAWGPFPGLEMKWHLEMPTNPATMEFSLNLGLPALPSFRHSLGAGWGIGAWADNTFFAEYAVSRKFGVPLLFSNLRVTWLATQIGEVLGEDFSKPFPSNQHLVFQGGLGMALRIADWPVLPDVVIPYFSLTVPQIPSGERRFRPADIPTAQWDMNLGLGWTF